MLRGVLFDLDDTLVDHQSAADAAVLAWAGELGVGDEHVTVRWARISEVHYGRYQRRELSFAQQRRARVREFVGADVSDREADALFAGYLERYEAGWTVFDDAIPALRRVRAAGLTAAVFTNGDERHQRFKLSKLGLSDEIDILIASSGLPAGKPDPRAFAHALSRAGLTAGEALMVGDSLEKDVLGAIGAGLGAVLVDRYDRCLAAGVPRISSLRELTVAGRER
ncbi:MAG TPA: HAD family hydrolase [Streptosporangiaceae bacterium]